MVPPALLPFYRNSAIREVKIPHTQMAMELMAPWSSPISMALVVPRAWLQAPMASPSRHRVGDAEPLGKQGGAYRTGDTGHCHSSGSDPLDAAAALRDAHRDGGGDAFGQQGGGQQVLHLEHLAQGQNTEQTDHAPRQAARQGPAGSAPAGSSAAGRYSKPAPPSPGPASA